MGMFFMSEEEEEVEEVVPAPPVEEAVPGLTGNSDEAVDAPASEEAHSTHTPDAPVGSDVAVDAAPTQLEAPPVEPAAEEEHAPPPLAEAPTPPEAPAHVVDAPVAEAEAPPEVQLPVVTHASLGSSAQEADNWAGGVCAAPTPDLSALHPYVPYAYASPVLDALHAGWAALEARGAATGECHTGEENGMCPVSASSPPPAVLVCPAAVVDVHLAHVPPHSIVLLTFFLAAVVFKLFDGVSAWRRAVALQGGLRKAAFSALRALPGISSLVAAEQGRVLRKLRSKEEPGKTLVGGGAGSPMPPAITALPPKGLPDDDVLDLALDMAQRDVAWTPGMSRMSGSVYMHDSRHFALLNRVYARFAHSNPLHGDIFAASGRMEREVVAMTASILGGGSRHGGSPSVCGCVTSGGTESILTAIRTTRDFFVEHKGISSPEMVVAVSAHAAVYKAAQYFGIKLVRVPVDSALQMDTASTRRAVTPNTVLIYASAPGFPHGIVDNIPALAAIAQAAGCGLHVDACLGGFLLPFAPKAGWRSGGQLPPFDFRVPGVTSMSVDTHKYGLAQKGSSVVLYANPELRRYQYTAVTEWSGGLYISPSTAGSRPGGLIAQTWASLMVRAPSCVVSSPHTPADPLRLPCSTWARRATWRPRSGC